MLSSSFARRFVYNAASLQLVCMALVFIAGPCNAFKLNCSYLKGYRVCEIEENIPRAPFEVGDLRDRNFSSPSKKLLERLKKSEGNTSLESKEGTSRFEATIEGSATDDQKKAVNFCMERAAENWISEVPVRVLVKFDSLGVQNLLGSAQTSRNYLVRDYICPVALAEAVLGQDLNNKTGSNLDYDVWMTLNSEARWYSGTDAQVPFGRYDLVTVCLHETYHGLFMSGGNIGINVEDDGSYRAFFFNSRYQGRFDSFMGNQDGCGIIGYESNDTSFGAVLTGNNLWFAEGTRRVGRLHAPRPYTLGSSLYHLSEWEYGEGGDDNDLMTPAIGSSYGQHNIGKVVIEMQKLVVNIEGKRGAEDCEVLRDPQADDGLINQGSGAESGGGDGGGSGDGRFVIRFGNSELNGWIVVGVGIGALGAITSLIILAVRTFAAAKRREEAARKETKKRRAQQPINFEIGNAGGLV